MQNIQGQYSILNKVYSIILILLLILENIPLNEIKVNAVEDIDIIDNKWATFLVGVENPIYATEEQAKEILSKLSEDSVIGKIAEKSLQQENKHKGERFGVIGKGLNENSQELDNGGGISIYANGELAEVPNSYLNELVQDMQKDLGTEVGNHSANENRGYRTFYQENWGLSGTSVLSVYEGYWSRPPASFCENCTGCAVDFDVSYNAWKDVREEISYQEMINNYGLASKEFKWLCENAHKYGFIWRYGVAGDTELQNTNIKTSMILECWHWRFVGVYHATKYWTKVEGYQNDSLRNYTWESYYFENISNQSGYPKSYYEALIKYYDKTKMTYQEREQKLRENEENNEIVETYRTDINTYYELGSGTHTGEHGCAAEVEDLKAHNYPIFLSMSEYISNNTDKIVEIDTWYSMANTLLTNSVGSNNTSTGSVNHGAYKNYTGGIIDSGMWVDLIATEAAEYCRVNPSYVSGGTSNVYTIDGKTYTLDSCCTTLVNLAWQVLGINVSTNSAGYENDTSVRNTLQGVGFTYKRLTDLTDSDWANLPRGSFFCTDGTGKGYGSHTEIFMGWVGTDDSKGAYMYDSGKGALGSPPNREARNYYNKWQAGCTTVEPGIKNYYTKEYISNWFHAVYIPSTSTGTILSQAVNSGREESTLSMQQGVGTIESVPKMSANTPSWVDCLKIGLRAMRKYERDNGYESSGCYNSSGATVEYDFNGTSIVARPDCSGGISACLLYAGIIKQGLSNNSSSYDSTATELAKQLTSGGFVHKNVKDMTDTELMNLSAGSIFAGGGYHVFAMDRWVSTNDEDGMYAYDFGEGWVTKLLQNIYK